MRHILFLLIFPPLVAIAQDERGDTGISVAPMMEWVTESKPHGQIEVSNTGTRTVEVVAETAFGVIGTTEDGQNTGVQMGGDYSPMRDLTPHITIFPPRMIIPAGKTQTVRYMIPQATLLPKGGYVSMVKFKMNQRAAVTNNQAPVVAPGVQMQFALVVPLVMIHGEGKAFLGVEPIDYGDDKLSVMVTNQSEYPWSGTIVLADEDSGSVYGEAPALIFTRRKVDIPVAFPLSNRLRVQFKSSDSNDAFRRTGTPDDVVLIRQ